MNIGTVVEGPSDRLVLQAVLNELCPGEHRYFPLQPSETFGELGKGWKGVRRWCYQTWQLAGSSLEKILSTDTGSPLDLLVIQVDAEIATEHDLQEDNEIPIPDVQQDCPPIRLTANQLEHVVERWLQRDNLPAQVILAIPAQDTENWTFAALFPNDPLCAQADYECIKSGHHRPGYRLTLARYGKRLPRSGRHVNKPEPRYRKLAPQIAANWETVCRVCSQAQRFSEDVLTFLSSSTDPTTAPDRQ